jgi:mycoredoxin
MMIKVFGADWCPMTNGTRKHLDNLGLHYEYINVERDENAAQWLREQNGGAERKPTVNIGGTVLSEPSNAQLDKVLREQSLIE